ncbi:MAG: ribonuclease III domain-containing protein [Firmicutes bacterium]|nr:ribonuclease III domain-containing protein [Bacillota bacterium]
MMNLKNPASYSALVLAYIGDAVYEIFVREKGLSVHPDMPAHKQHVENVKIVRAQAQSKSMGVLENMLTEQEYAVYKRGRNAKSATVPKNANLIDYRRATGFEALLGYLHLSGQKERLNELMEIAYNSACTVTYKNQEE